MATGPRSRKDCGTNEIQLLASVGSASVFLGASRWVNSTLREVAYQLVDGGVWFRANQVSVTGNTWNRAGGVALAE
jgi:hypothetical protein